MQDKLIITSIDLERDEEGYLYYEGILFTGIEHWFYKTGELGSKTSYVDGIQDGWAIGWYKNGQMSGETFYEKGCVKGSNKEWYENGQMKLDEEIVSGQSLWEKEWDELGNLISEKKYTQ